MLNLSYITLITEHIEEVKGFPELPELSEEEQKAANSRLQEIRSRFKKRTIN